VIMGVVLRLTNYRVMFLCLTLMAFLNIGYFCLFLRRKQR
jgi:hypothetical protein